MRYFCRLDNECLIKEQLENFMVHLVEILPHLSKALEKVVRSSWLKPVLSFRSQ